MNTTGGNMQESPQENLSRAAVESLESPLLRRLEFHEEIASTQERARELALAGAPHGTLVISRVQTGGLGRRGRGWVSPPGGIWTSLVLRPALKTEHYPRTTQAAAVGVAKTLHAIGIGARIKWPNDLLVSGRKICGILAAGAPDFITLGIGLNANLDPYELETPPGTATSIRSSLGYDVDLAHLLQDLLGHLQEEFRRLENFEDVLDDWRKLNCTLGKRVRVHKPDKILEGTAVDLSFEGALVLDTGYGEVELFEGDVEHLRFRDGTA